MKKNIIQLLYNFRLIAVLTFIIAATVSSVAQDCFFNKISEMQGVTSVYISPKMFSLMKGSVDKDDKNMDNIISKLTGLQILSCENKNAANSLRKEVAYINPKNGYEELLRIKDDSTHVVIYCKENNETGKNGKYGNENKTNKKENEYVLVADETDEFSIILLKGIFTLDEVQSIMNDLP